jgi:uncharacterized membrane protein
MIPNRPVNESDLRAMLIGAIMGAIIGNGGGWGGMIGGAVAGAFGLLLALNLHPKNRRAQSN